MLALVDCNNFYVSCERLFDPGLRRRPVAVLSNNDGCIVARSEEVKSLGVPMGAPYFEWRALLDRHRAAVLSSNYELYADLSDRVMVVLRDAAPRVEVYSIDEAFLDLSGVRDREGFARGLRERVLCWTGIPVSIGVAPTKTLAKLANHLAKREAESAGVLDLPALPDPGVALGRVGVGEVWGIGPRWAARLEALGIRTARDLRDLSPVRIPPEMGVSVRRTVAELRGVPAWAVGTGRVPRKSAVVSRSFGRPVRDLREIREAVASYAARASAKLREDGRLARTVTVTLVERGGRGGGSASVSFELPAPADAAPPILAAAVRGVERLFRPGREYKKAGVVLSDLLPAGEDQAAWNDWLDGRDPARDRRLAAAVDAVHARLGTRAIQYAAEGTAHPWGMRRGRRSPRYTTSWDELPVVAA